MHTFQLSSTSGLSYSCFMPTGTKRVCKILRPASRPVFRVLQSAWHLHAMAGIPAGAARQRAH